MKTDSKEFKLKLKTICKVCNHPWGKHNDVGMCSSCYDENKEYKHHRFEQKIKGEK